MRSKRVRPLVWLFALVMAAMALFIVACTNTQPSGDDQAGTPVAPEPNENGVVTAEQWAEVYPDIYASYMSNGENTQVSSYNENFPFLETLYAPSGFATGYIEARGHVYTLADVSETSRPHALANCLSCKSPEMTALVNSEGIEVYAAEFDEVFARISEPVSCYSCHANSGSDLVVTSQFLLDALGADASQVDDAILVCGQCHNEYYFNGETKAVTLPWSGLAAMNPDDILAYYNEMGFVDFTNATSGAGMIKVQHPEIETILGQGSKAPMMGNLTCADCHMGPAVNDNGDEYTSHRWVSPLASPDLLEASCNSCHSDLAGTVAGIQSEVVRRETEIGEDLAELHALIGAAAEDGSKTDEELAELRQIVRDAQFYWDFSFVENSEGAHNSALANYVLDKAEALVQEGLSKF